MADTGRSCESPRRKTSRETRRRCHEYVPTPAVGTSKAAAAAGVAGTASSTEIDRRRRRFAWTLVIWVPGGVVPGILPVFSSQNAVRA